jgi:26S proteasome regulatory subunit N2
MYHLEAYEDALRLALKSGDLFDIEERSEYTEKMIGQCIDEYSHNRVAAAKDPAVPAPPARMEAIVMRMFERCFRDGAWNQAVGVAIEARRLDVVEDAISRAGSGSPQSRSILASVYDSALKFVTTHEYRTSIFQLLKKVRAPMPRIP